MPKCRKSIVENYIVVITKISGKNSTCADGEFQCRGVFQSKQCIPYSKVCDKQTDCTDGSDEPLHCGVNECARVQDNGCGHRCIDTKESYRCECNQGETIFFGCLSKAVEITNGSFGCAMRPIL